MSPRHASLAQVVATLRDARSLCIAGHARPDGDCIGSQLGLGLALRAAGKEVEIWNEDPVPRKLAFLDPDGVVSRPRSGRRFDVVVALDCAAHDRLGSVAACIADRGLLLNVDHHASNTLYGDLNWIVPEVPSTGELVLQILQAAGWSISPPVADGLFTAISTDTGSFQYPSTTPGTLRAAAYLVERGANLGRICQRVYQSFPLSRFRLVRHVYQQARLTHGNRIAYFWLRKADYARAGADREETEGLIDHVRAIETVVVACVFEEQDDGVVRLSLRSKSDSVDVAKIAQQFGGGGHPAAAGAKVPGTPLAVQRRVMAALRRAVDAAGPAPLT